MDASQYKDYVLVLLFVKYVSDKYAGDPNALLEVPAGGGFADMVAAKNDKEIGDKLNKIIGRLANANENLKGALNVADFNLFGFNSPPLAANNLTGFGFDTSRLAARFFIFCSNSSRSINSSKQ